jgi:hypothetical protein
MEELKTNSGQNLGIAALITAIITFIFAIIPCVGMIAIIPGIVAIVLASVGLSQASKNNSPKGILIAGLIIGIFASMISFSQFFVAGKIARHADKWPKEFNSVINDVKDNVLKNLEDANVSIKIESNGDTVKIDTHTSTKRKDLEQTLEDLESAKNKKNDTIKKVK